ncbi:MAG: NUDIX hydrolase [bacterium]|nr:NUDIX hydrolase [bacterium]
MASLTDARATIASCPTRDAEQVAVQARILRFIDQHEDALVRTCLSGHLTASALLIDDARERVLLHHHKKLERWLQFGGHCDGDGDLRACAARETLEESGIEPAWMSPAPIDLDVHAIPARRDEPEHDHHDVRYLTVAPAGAVARISEESRALRWFTPIAARELAIDDSVRRLLDLAFA